MDYLIREKLPKRLPQEPDADAVNSKDLSLKHNKTIYVLIEWFFQTKMPENQTNQSQIMKKSVSEERKLSASNNNLTVYKPTLRR